MNAKTELKMIYVFFVIVELVFINYSLIIVNIAIYDKKHSILNV